MYVYLQVQHKRVELLKHPLVVRLIDYKWRKVALPLLIPYMWIYLLFVALLTAFTVISPRPHPLSVTCEYMYACSILFPFSDKINTTKIICY